MIVPATVDYKTILDALDVADIPGVDLHPRDKIDLLAVEIDEYEVECPFCHGVEADEVGDTVNPRLIADFLKAISTGDIHTAQALVSRVFETPSDVAIVDRGLCQCSS